MKIKTSDLLLSPLDWAVAKAQKIEISFQTSFITADPINVLADWDRAREYSPSTNRDQGLEIIERVSIWTRTTDEGNDDPSCLWRAEVPYRAVEVGPTILVAAMRCYVALELGDEVDVPDELCLLLRGSASSPSDDAPRG